MTKAELIEALAAYPDDRPVCLDVGYAYHDVTEVDEDDDYALLILRAGSDSPSDE